MNISGIQNLIWLGSLLAGGYLGWYLYDFKQHEATLVERVSDDVIRTAIRDVVIPEPENHIEFDFPVVEQIYHKMNWNGIPPVEPVVVEQPKEETTEAPVTPVSELLDVLFLRAALFAPESSQVMVNYTAPELRSGETLATLVIGDRLPAPYDNIIVESIAPEGATFSFDDEMREPELVAPAAEEGGFQIVEAGADGALMPAATTAFNVLPDPAPYRPTNSVMIGSNRWRVGTYDAERFATDYPSIIAQVDHRRHRNATTRQYDGIEIQSVPPGSIAAANGVKAGDVIKSINGTPVTSVQEAIQYAKSHSDQYTTWEIVIENKGAEKTVYYETPSN